MIPWVHVLWTYKAGGVVISDRLGVPERFEDGADRVVVISVRRYSTAGYSPGFQDLLLDG